MSKYIIYAGFTLAALLAGCANPQVAAPVGPVESERSCDELADEIRKAEGLRIASRDEDRFQWKYILVANAFVSAYRMNKAEAAAENRLRGLQQMAAQKNCPPVDLSPLSPNYGKSAPPRKMPQSQQPLPQTSETPPSSVPAAQENYGQTP